MFKSRKKEKLYQFFDDEIPYIERCTKKDCHNPHTHTTQGHLCLYCGKHDTHMKKCPSIDHTYFIDRSAPEFIMDILKSNNIKVGSYIVMYGGQRCSWIARNNNKRIEIFFMHGDCYGQYGENTSDMPRLNYFVSNYKFQSTNYD